MAMKAKTDIIKTVNQNLSITDRRMHDALQKKTSTMWRNFWIKAAKRQGYSITEIAAEFEISEGTVRYVLAKS